MGDLRRALAFAFRRKGGPTLAGTELRYLLAFDLRWFAPEDAKRVVARALECGLLRDEAGVLTPAFDVTTVEVPVNFRPTLAVLDEAYDAPGPTPGPAPGHDAEVEAERRRLHHLVSADVARLIVERRRGVDVAQRAAALEAAMHRT